MAKANAEDLIRKLDEMGYKVTKKADRYERKTFVIEKELVAKFSEVQKRLDRKVQDCIAEAIRDWVKKKG